MTEQKKESTFDVLSKIKCKVEKKGRFNYVSWASAWADTKKNFPNANYIVYENSKGIPAFIVNGRGGFVKVGVIINEIEHIEHFPILDYSNKPIKSELINVFDINKSIKRALVKALAFHGTGLYVYEGEDLPEE